MEISSKIITLHAPHVTLKISNNIRYAYEIQKWKIKTKNFC